MNIITSDEAICTFPRGTVVDLRSYSCRLRAPYRPGRISLSGLRPEHARLLTSVGHGEAVPREAVPGTRRLCDSLSWVIRFSPLGGSCYFFSLLHLLLRLN